MDLVARIPGRGMRAGDQRERRGIKREDNGEQWGRDYGPTQVLRLSITI